MLAAQIVRQIAAGQAHDLLVVEVVGPRRDDEAVGQQIVHLVGAHGAGKPQVVDLHRRQPMHEGRRAATRRVAVEIDRDVEAEGTRQIDDFAGRFVGNRVPVVE